AKSADTHGHDIQLAADAHTALLTTAQLLQNRLAALRSEAMEPLSATQKAQILELKEWGEGEKEIAFLVGASVAAVHRYIEAHKCWRWTSSTRRRSKGFRRRNKSWS